MSVQEVKPHKSIVSILTKNSSISFAVGIAAVLALLIIPLPTFILDILLSCSIALAVSVLIITLSARNALELSTFPSLLLFVTLFRLSLNVASTRLILLNANAGDMINTFGNLVIGGNLVVGMVMFLILVIIQFIVITKGAERISEVNARFTLDAMPGKQMAIDADLNAGAITDAEATQRRKDIARESEFYGAMDGASKFVRGDAIAGLIITCINLIGGIIIGSINGMTVGSAAETYSKLSIGDGLVSQIPSIIIAISSGFLVTKTTSKESVSHDLTSQLLQNSQPLMIAAFLIGSLALIPGLPKIPFILIAAGCVVTSLSTKKALEQKTKKIKSTEVNDNSQSSQKAPVEELLNVDMISVQVGVQLIEMVDPRKKSNVFERIGSLRKKFAKELGIIVPLVRLCDNINLEPNLYQIKLFDHVIAEGKLEPSMFLAMDSGIVQSPVEGIPTHEPVYGLPAIWVTKEKKETAELSGYTVIDPESVMITHLSETLARHAYEMLTREDVQMLVNRLRETQPSLVGEVVGDLVSLGLLQKVLQNLLKDRIPVRNLAQILEALGEHATKTKSPTLLTELARKKLARTITECFKDSSTGKVMAITFDPALEHYMLNSLQKQGDELTLGLAPDEAMEISNQLAQAWRKAMENACENVVLLCDSRQRSALSSLTERILPRLAVLAYDEIDTGAEIEPVETVKVETNDQMQQQQRNQLQPAGI